MASLFSVYHRTVCRLKLTNADCICSHTFEPHSFHVPNLYCLVYLHLLYARLIRLLLSGCHIASQFIFNADYGIIRGMKQRCKHVENRQTHLGAAYQKKRHTMHGKPTKKSQNTRGYVITHIGVRFNQHSANGIGRFWMHIVNYRLSVCVCVYEATNHEHCTASIQFRG